MQGFNKVILAGNITRDPQLKYLPSNLAVCEFGLALNRRWRDKDGNQKEDVCFVDISAFGKQAEVINQYMSKGKSILVEGRLKLDQWTGQDGQKKSRLSVVAENFTFLGGPRDGGGPGGGGEYGGAPATRENSERGGGGGSGYSNAGRGPSGQTQRAAAPSAAAGYESYDEPPPTDDRPPTNDDIPF